MAAAPRLSVLTHCWYRAERRHHLTAFSHPLINHGIRLTAGAALRCRADITERDSIKPVRLATNGYGW